MKGRTKWIVPIMGFRESAGRETGIERLWRDLRAYSSEQVIVVAPYEWDEPMRDITDFILRNSPTEPEVMVVAYSWGCGVGFTGLAEAAHRVGLPIRYALLCDPVYRSRLLPCWLPINPMSVTHILRPAISVPASVERVEWIRQCETIPHGHDLVADDPERTQIGLGRYSLAGHTKIDDSAEFRALVEFWAAVFVHDLPPDDGEPTVLGLDERPISFGNWREVCPA